MRFTELDYLANSQAAGKWGFQIGSVSVEGQNQGVSVLTADLPPFMARVWTLNLLAYRFQNTPLPVTNGLLTTNGQPPDNQTYNTGLRARLDYGVDSASESVRFDYPSRGCTVQFHAASVRLYLESPVAAFSGGTPIAPPLLGGFMSPQGRGNVAADKLPCCTYTETLLNTLIFPAVQFWWAPARARAYRIIPFNATAAALQWVARQRDFAQAIISLDMDNTFFEPFVAANGSTVMDHRDQFMPLMPMAQGVSVELAAIGTALYTLQWLLDIG